MTSLDKQFLTRLGLRIKKARLEKNMTLHKCGLLLGISAQQISKYESGVNSLSLLWFIRFAAVLGKPLTYFIDFE